MADDTDITLWVNRHRLKALQEHDINVENRLDRFFSSLYKEFVPDGEREIIEARIQSEQEESDRYYEQNRRFALMEIIENGASCYCESDNCTTLFAAASRFVKALKTQKASGKQFQGGLTDLAFGDCLETDPAYIKDYTSHHSNDPRVVFCAEVNFDKGYINDWNVGYCGWTQYNTDRLADGVRAATRKKYLTPEQREQIFEAKVNEGNPEFDADEDADMGIQMQ
jgi:hypothetical protein